MDADYDAGAADEVLHGDVEAVVGVHGAPVSSVTQHTTESERSTEPALQPSLRLSGRRGRLATVMAADFAEDEVVQAEQGTEPEPEQEPEQEQEQEHVPEPEPEPEVPPAGIGRAGQTGRRPRPVPVRRTNNTSGKEPEGERRSTRASRSSGGR